MSLTVCSVKKIEWSPFGLKLISLEAAKQQVDAVDLIDAFVKTLVWVSEVGWKCFETKSFAPILYSDVKMQEYNQNCDWVMAHADAAIAGNLDHDLGDYETRLQKIILKTCSLKSAKNDGPTSIWLQKRYSELIAIQEKLLAKRKNTDIRFNPIGWALVGDTGIGKTTLGKLTMQQSLAAMGYSDENGVVDDSRIITKDMFDKYDSTWTTDILGVFLDDVNNTKAEFQKDTPHTATIIKFFNNVAAQAVKAELNSKGVVFIDFKCGIVTSNTRDLGARIYSNCPESILRRMYHVHFTVKDEYCKTGTKLLDTNHPKLRNSTSLVQDVWNIDIKWCRTFEAASGKTAYELTPLVTIQDDGSSFECSNMDLKTYLDMVIKLSTEHKISQDKLLEKSKTCAKTQFCNTCFRFPEYCDCAKHKDIECEPHSFELCAGIVNTAATYALNGLYSKWMSPYTISSWFFAHRPIRGAVTKALAAELRDFAECKLMPGVAALIPNCVYNNRRFQRFVKTWASCVVTCDVRKILIRFMIFFASLLFYGMYYKKYWAVLLSLFCMCVSFPIGRAFVNERVAVLEKEYLERRDALPAYVTSIRESAFPKAIAVAATLIIAIKAIQMWNSQRLKTLPQALTPEEIDAQPGWFGFMMKRIGFTADSRVTGATRQQVEYTGSKNLGHCVFTRADGSRTGCNIIVPEKGYVWFPKHVFYVNGDMETKPTPYVRGVVQRNDTETSKFKFIAQLGVNTVEFDGIDMVECFVERCPDVCTNLMKFLPHGNITGVSSCSLLIRNKDGTLSTDKVVVTHGKYGHRYLSGPGGCYNSSVIGGGSCMAMLITESMNPVVAGFHIGGNPLVHYGVMMTVNQQLARETREKMLSLRGIRGMANATVLPEKQYDRPILQSSDVHPNAKSIVALTSDDAVDVLGSTKRRAQQSSRVVDSVLKKSTERVFGIKSNFGPPKLIPNWKAYNATLEHVVNPSEMFLPSLLQRARRDWLQPIRKFTHQLNQTETVRPLTDKEVIMGIPGKRFIDAMPMNTSLGFPLFGKKERKFTQVYNGEDLIDRIPDEDIIAERDRLIGCWKRGERGYPIITATLKDEPTKLDSEKVRVFQAVSIALSMCIRKYYLPIARVLSLCPELSESAVGVNAFSQQWDALMSHAEKFAADNRVIAWDYSKYDVRMNSQMTYAVLMSFIDIAELCDYSHEDLHIMNMMIADIIHPVMDWNGTLISAYNMNTSGNNITVNINSVANSLYVRMGFFCACPEVRDFRSAVAALTYGDDFKGSVHSSYRTRFNFRVFKEFLAKHGMKITDPNKTENVADDLDIDEADFLKRKSQYIPEIGVRIGKLSKDSMLKPLLANLKSRTESPENVAVSCVETYMHELFAHGRLVYNQDQTKIKQICMESLGFIPPAVNATFDERVEMWHEKYSKQNPSG
jgi:hypothetical protein